MNLQSLVTKCEAVHSAPAGEHSWPHFADTVPVAEPFSAVATNDDDEEWLPPTKISTFSLVVIVLLAVASVASCMQGLSKVGG